LIKQLSVIGLVPASLALAAALALAACQDTATGSGRNTAGAPVVTGRAVATRVESPLPRQTQPAGERPAPDATPALSFPTPPTPEPTPTTPEPAPQITLIPPEKVAKQVRVGILLPLSGPRADIGRALLDAASLAVFEISNENFMLMPFDTRGTAEGAAAAAQDALAANVRLVIGPVFSAAVQAAAPVLLQAGVNTIALSNNQAVAKPGVYLAGLFPELQIERVIGYAARRGARRIAALVPAGPFGQRAAQTVRASAAAGGMDIVEIREFGPPGDKIAEAVRIISDYETRRDALLKQRKTLEALEDEGSKRALKRLEILETLGPLPFDALVVAASGEDLVKAAAQLGNFDVDTKRSRLLGLSSWAAPKTGREPALVGGWYAVPPLDADDEFSFKYTGMYESEPHPLGPATYDLVALAAILGSEKDGPKFDRAILTAETGFAGAGGLFRLRADGLSDRALEVREVLTDGSRVLDPAQARFEALSN
jgi:branched-chain amino acid transport system substrate-binding protein